MTHPIYSEQYLLTLKRPQLWSICEQLALPKHASNAKCVEVILGKQARQVEKAAEINLATREISFYHHEVVASDEVVAEIKHDASDFVTQRWVVTISGIEIHRADTWQKCYGHISRRYKQGTLPKHEVLQQVTPVKQLETEVREVAEEVGLEVAIVYHSSFSASVKKPPVVSELGFRSISLGRVGCLSTGQWWARKSDYDPLVKVGSVQEAIAHLYPRYPAKVLALN